jgi:hypothetical protein
MAVDKRTAFLKGYDEMLRFIPFLSSFFVTTPRDIVNAESFKIDIRRGTKKIAPVISNITQIGGKIKKSIYTQKEFTPPILAVSSDFAPGDLTNKAFSMTEYESADEDYQVQLQTNISDSMNEIENEMSMNPEYQASQILQTGAMTLYDDQGLPAFDISFSPKATHFPTVGTSWSDPAADMNGDILSLYQVIKKDSGVNARNIVFGADALMNYIDGNDFAKVFDLQRVKSGEFDPNETNPDVNFLGDLLIGYKRFQCWLYEGEYQNPAAANDDLLPFVEPDKVLLLPDGNSPNVDFRTVWCTVPTITGVDPRFAGLVPSSMELSDRQFTTRVWVEGSSDTLNVELKARPLSVPVSIDAFGCIDTEI